MVNQELIAQMRLANERILQMAETDRELAGLRPDPELTKTVQQPDLSYQKILSTIFARFADRPALATRAYELAIDPESGEHCRHILPAYTAITYGELARRTEAIANFWRHTPEHQVSPGDMVAFLAFNGADMTVVDTACTYANAVVVPLQANYLMRDLDEILADTAPVTLVASIDNLVLAVTLALQHHTIRSLIVIAADDRVGAERRMIEHARQRLAEAGGHIALATFADAVEAGCRYRFEPLPAPEGGRDRMVMIMYTSGSTGTPKGAIIHEAICVSAWTSPRSAAPMVAFIFAPMNHSLGRYTLYAVLGQGGTAYFTQYSDLSTILEDIRLARPTSLLLIPRVCELAQQHYLAEVSRRVSGGSDSESAAREVRAAMRSTFLGDRLASASVGSAPTTPELRQLMSEIFGIPVSDGYGNTESGGGGITIDTYVSPSVTDYKLIDVPELGYYTSDQPHARGELLIKTRNMIRGYFKRPEATAALFDPDGFLKTGDIMEQYGSDRLVWLDRRNNVIKLSQGEYVAIGPLETAYLGHGRLIDQIYLYGSSHRGFLLAVVVPALGAARGMLGHEPSDEELHRLVLEDLRAAASQAKLKSFEVPRDVVIEHEPFSLHNGLLSAVGKPLRANLRARYVETLEAVYRDMDRKLNEERALLRADGGRSTIQRVADAFRLNLGLTALDPESPASYMQLGGDSLGAVNMALLLEEIFDVAVPVTSVLHPAASPGRLAAQIDALKAGAVPIARYEDIHPDPDHSLAAELTLDALLGKEVLAQAASAAPPAETSHTVLITGANGFLGRFVCLDWLERLAPRGGKVICLIRGSDPASARRRLEAVFGGADARLRARFEALAAHLEVIAADLSAPRLGLDEAAYARLATEVDQIVHVAALVNHRLSYRNLFEPNVLGTAELVRLAVSERIKRFDYVSSVAVTHLGVAITKAAEDADVRVTVPRIEVGGDRYALGYSASKWAGEVILREAHELAGLPVNIFRADMILPHSRYAGQINAPDSFTRLLASLVMTRVAPKSFYELDAEGQRQSAHYDGLPVDFVAGFIQQIGASGQNGFHSYNVLNVHETDGVSLDVITDWIARGGYDLPRIDEYERWLQRFRERLENLPDRMRQNSCLSIIGRFAAPFPVRGLSPVSGAFVAAVRDLPVAPEVPHLSEAYIRKCLQDMILLGLIDAPVLVPA